jgi:8-oxo-dGTP diphosphatase
MRGVEVAAGVLFDGARVLACQRAEGGTHPGKWEFPGGKREAGETLAQCLERELFEELGVRSRIGARLWQTSHLYPGAGAVEVSFFAVATVDRAPANRAFAAIRWVALEELADLDLLEADRPLVRQLAGGELALSRTRGT